MVGEVPLRAAVGRCRARARAARVRRGGAGCEAVASAVEAPLPIRGEGRTPGAARHEARGARARPAATRHPGATHGSAAAAVGRVGIEVDARPGARGEAVRAAVAVPVLTVARALTRSRDARARPGGRTAPTVQGGAVGGRTARARREVLSGVRAVLHVRAGAGVLGRVGGARGCIPTRSSVRRVRCPHVRGAVSRIYRRIRVGGWFSGVLGVLAPMSSVRDVLPACVFVSYVRRVKGEGRARGEDVREEGENDDACRAHALRYNARPFSISGASAWTSWRRASRRSRASAPSPTPG